MCREMPACWKWTSLYDSITRGDCSLYWCRMCPLTASSNRCNRIEFSTWVVCAYRRYTASCCWTVWPGSPLEWWLLKHVRCTTTSERMSLLLANVISSSRVLSPLVALATCSSGHIAAASAWGWCWAGDLQLQDCLSRRMRWTFAWQWQADPACLQAVGRTAVRRRRAACRRRRPWHVWVGRRMSCIARILRSNKTSTSSSRVVILSLWMMVMLPLRLSVDDPRGWWMTWEPVGATSSFMASGASDMIHVSVRARTSSWWSMRFCDTNAP